MHRDPGLHVFLFCCAEYRDLIGYCINSVRRHVKDHIRSITVVSNIRLDIDDPDIRLIMDQEFWQRFDPGQDHRSLYNKNWMKQQLFKLNVDRYVSGDVLIVDAEVLFLRDITWKSNNRIDVYTATEYSQSYFDLMRHLLALEKSIHSSFIVDAMVFSTDILENLREDIQHHHDRHWLDVFDDAIIGRDHHLSEFELYGNYVAKKHPDRVNILIDPIDYLIVMDDRQRYGFDELLELLRARSPVKFLSVNVNTHSWNGSETIWATFYQQVRDPSWPDCDREQDFGSLPKHIQRECIEVFGYQPKS
jgi:hypothetical protein